MRLERIVCGFITLVLGGVIGVEATHALLLSILIVLMIGGENNEIH